MKQISFKRKIFILIIITMLIIPLDVFAITPTFLGKYDRGVTRVSFWLDYSSGVGFYETQIINAKQNWQTPGWWNPIVMVAASSNSGTMMDIYRKTYTYFCDSPCGILGMTEYFISGGGQVYPWEVNLYRWTNIQLNHNSLSERTTIQRQGTIAHEMGHAFGLSHYNSNPYSIMCQSTSRITQTVGYEDNEAILAKY